MRDYRIARQEPDGSWCFEEFRAADDPEAISYGLNSRTAARCELFQGDRWVATFDGTPEPGTGQRFQANENRDRCPVEMESEVAYFHRRALEAREQARISASVAARRAHLGMAEHLESLGRAVQAEQRRRSFHDVNAALDKPAGQAA